MYFNLLILFINISYSQIIAALLGEPVDHVHIHNLLWDSTYLAKLQHLEAKQDSPLSYHNPEFKSLNTKWIHEPGVHLGIHQATRQIIFMLRVTYVNYYLIILLPVIYI